MGKTNGILGAIPSQSDITQHLLISEKVYSEYSSEVNAALPRMQKEPNRHIKARGAYLEKRLKDYTKALGHFKDASSKLLKAEMVLEGKGKDKGINGNLEDIEREKSKKGVTIDQFNQLCDYEKTTKEGLKAASALLRPTFEAYQKAKEEIERFENVSAKK